MRALKEAISAGTRQAKRQHHNAGYPVYVADFNGNLCVELPSGELRKLTGAEIEAALA